MSTLAKNRNRRRAAPGGAYMPILAPIPATDDTASKTMVE